MEKFLPLNEEQLKKLRLVKKEKNTTPFRILANGQSVNICTGGLSSKGSNIMYHPVYWDYPLNFIKQVVSNLEENNPGIKITYSYH